MERKECILLSYYVLKDVMENDDDFSKMSTLVEEMSKIDPMGAFDMWYPLINQYMDYVVNHRVNETYHLMRSMDVLERTLGSLKMDEMVLKDNFLRSVLLSKYCYAGGHYDYTQRLASRALTNQDVRLADQLLSEIFGNPNRYWSWYDIIDGFLFDIKYGDFLPSKGGVNVLEKWAIKIEDRKDQTKILSSMLATGLAFNLSIFDNVEETSVQEPSTTQERKQSRIDTEALKVPLCKMIKKYPDAQNSRQRLKALLLDVYPQNRLFVNALLMAYDEEIVNEIVQSKDIGQMRVHRMCMVLMNNYGISEELAVSVIHAWIAAYKNNLGGC